MNHDEIWANARPIEPERARYVESVPELTSKLPDYLFAVDNDETRMVDIFVIPPLPKSTVFVLLAPYKICRVRHEGTRAFPHHHFYSASQCPQFAELFFSEHNVRFQHDTTEGVRDLNSYELQGYAYAVAPSSPLRPEVLLLMLASRFVINSY